VADRNEFSKLEGLYNMIPKATLKPKAIAKRSYGDLSDRGRGFGTGAGLPSKYDPKLCAKVFRLRLLGLSELDIAGAMDVSQSTIQLWVKKYPAFQRAWDAGGNAADAHVAHALWRRANGWSHEATKIVSTKDGITKVPYIERFPPDTGAMELWLTNRSRQVWKRRSSTELTGADDKPLIPQLPPILVLDFSGEDINGPLIEGTDVYEKRD
jgi:hypothetical protein